MTVKELCSSSVLENSAEAVAAKTHENKLSEVRFGMFVHWGLYALAGVHEQHWQRWNMAADKYTSQINSFNPQNADPAEWIALARKAGMEYLCFTTKHHDGFCLWDTEHTDFKITNSPYGKDFLRLLADECHRQDFPLVLYYSVVDWHHPAYPNLGRHHEIKTDESGHDMKTYVDYVKKQMRELCTNYGDIAGIWWDMNVPEYIDESVHDLIRSLQPGIVFNNRGFGKGDFSTPERDWDPECANTSGDIKFSSVEACQSVGVNSWGFRKDEDYYSALHLMKSISSRLGEGARFLLNVGPDGDGRIPPEATKLLERIGKWLNPLRRYFNGTSGRGKFDDPLIRMLESGDGIIIHYAGIPESTTISLAPLDVTPKKVTLLNTGEDIAWTTEPVVYNKDSMKSCLRLRNIPVDKLSEPAAFQIYI